MIIETVARRGWSRGRCRTHLLRRLYRVETLSRVTERYIFDDGPDRLAGGASRT